MRRSMLGDTYVESMTTDSDPVSQEFQDYLTSMAWGVWAREGRSSRQNEDRVAGRCYFFSIKISR